MRALFLNATLKPSPEESSTAALAEYVGARLRELGADVEHVRLADHTIAPGVVSEAIGEDDEWPGIHAKVLAADIVVFAAPTWLGRPSSIIYKVLERMDAMLAETADDGTPVAYNKVAGVIIVGNEDGAHHGIFELSGQAGDLGFTVPGQAWTYWNQGPGPGETEYLSASDELKEWTHTTGDAMASNLVHAAKALAAAPIPAPPS